MANVFRIQVRGGPLTIAQLEQLAGIAKGLVNEVTREHPSAGRNTLRWTVEEASAGSFNVSLAGHPADADVAPVAAEEVTHALTEGLRALETEARRPAYFSDRALEHAKSLASFASSEVTGVEVGGTDGRVPLDAQLVANVDQIMGKQVESIGSVEGRMEAVNIHDRPTFVVYDNISGQRFECRFGDRIDLDDVRTGLGKRVVASGRIRRRPGGTPIVTVTGLRILREREELPSADDVRGILKEG